MDPVTVVLGALFLTAGILFGAGRLLGHIPAWRAMPPDEKAKIRIGPLCRNIGAVIGLSGLLFLMNGICPAFRGRGFSVAMILWVIAAAADVLWIGKSRRYQKE